MTTINNLSHNVRSVGILGAGRVGTAIGRLMVAAGYEVRIAASSAPEKIAMIVDVLCPGAKAVTSREAIANSDLVILAVPLWRYRSIPFDQFDHKIIVDTMNYWPPVDGAIDEFENSGETSSEVIQGLLPRTARLVKTLNHIGYHDMDERPRPAGASDRIALALAGDDSNAVALVAQVISAAGFDPVVAGRLATGRAFEPGMPLFGAVEPADELQRELAAQAGSPIASSQQNHDQELV